MKHMFTILVTLAFFANTATGQYSLPKLDYNYEDLEPYIDAKTMEIHHSKHHQAYITNLNKALVGTKIIDLPLEEILISVEKRGPAIRNNGGGHYNHSLFWKIMSPQADKTPSGKLADEITKTFTSLDSLKRLINAQAATRFGSGWAWLYVTPEKKLAVSSTPNQDNPIMDVSKDARGIPILGIDVWEHAYYLKFQNKRGDYLASIWNVIDWDTVNELYEKAFTSPLLTLIEKDAWVALKDFHMVMAQTFHPMEEGNYAPIKERAAEMSAKAQVLKASKIPASFDNAKIKDAIARLASGSEKLQKIVKKGKEPKIKESLTKLHDVFHEIQELCAH